MLPTSERYAAEDLFALWRVKGRAAAESLVHSIGDTGITQLHWCPACRFGCWHPMWLGVPEFYDAIQVQSTYYLKSKWEYDCSAMGISPGTRLLDFGCGAGAFLRLSEGLGAPSIGIEPNDRAREQATRKGLRVVPDFDALDSAWPNAVFDVVTAFQVLEHVPDPVATLRRLAQRVRRGGSIFVAVPNADGMLRWVRPGPKNMPPHHVSWWTRDALFSCASRANLKVTGLAREPLSARQYDHVGYYVRHGLLAGLGVGAARGSGRWFVDQAAFRSACLVMRLLDGVGVHQLSCVDGHSVLARMTTR